jgi:hypothetical protein
MRITLKWILKIKVRGYEMDSSISQQGPVVDSSEHGSGVS